MINCYGIFRFYQRFICIFMFLNPVSSLDFAWVWVIARSHFFFLIAQNFILRLNHSRCSLCNSCFQCYVHSSYRSTSFDIHLSTSCLKWASHNHCMLCLFHVTFMLSSKGHASGVWLVNFDMACLLSMPKNGWRKKSAMHVILKAGIRLFLIKISWRCCQLGRSSTYF